MSQLIKKVKKGYKVVHSKDEEIIPDDNLIPHEIWTSFPDNFSSKTVVRPGIQEAEIDNYIKLYKSALEHAEIKGIPFFELCVNHSASPTGNKQPQKYHVWAEAQIRLYNLNKK